MLAIGGLNCLVASHRDSASTGARRLLASSSLGVERLFVSGFGIKISSELVKDVK